MSIEEKIQMAPEGFDLFFPCLVKYSNDLDIPYQYRQIIVKRGMLEDVEKQIILICIWSTDNLEHSWYISKKWLFILNSFKNNNIISFEFNFVSDTDLMAFKLRWK